MENNSNKGIKITGILLSAGFSSRMGEFKPLLKLPNGKSFLVTIVEKLSLVCNDFIVVTGFNKEAIEKELSQLKNNCSFRTIFNENFKDGMFSSLQKAVSVLESDWYIYHFVDQPSLPIEFYKEFINEIDTDFNWIQPINEDGKGHPILFDKEIQELIITNNYDNLKSISHLPTIKKKYFEYNSPIIHQDIDIKTKYKSLL